MKFVDFHTHTDNPDPEVISLRSFRYGVEEIVWGEFTTAAIHPWDVLKQLSTSEFETIIPQLFAVGECGIDKFHPDIALQSYLLRKQIELAIKYNKCIILHVVKAHNEVISILKEYKNQNLRAAIHSFVGNELIAREYTDLGCFLSFSPLSFGSHKSVEALKSVDKSRILLETDDSNAKIEDVYNSGAKILGLEIDILKQNIYYNYHNISYNTNYRGVLFSP